MWTMAWANCQSRFIHKDIVKLPDILPKDQKLEGDREAVAPSHKRWHKSLALLRDLGPETPNINGKSYCCVDEEHPGDVVYLYPHLSEDTFRAVEANCASETSRLSQALSPLLKARLSASCVSRLSSDIRLTCPGAFKNAPKCLEFLTLRYPEPQPRGMSSVLSFILESHSIGGSNRYLHTAPVRLFSDTSSDDNKAFVYWIEWKSIQVRTVLFADPMIREQMRPVYSDNRGLFLQHLGKTDEDLTWEETFRVFFLSMGADVQSRFVMATLVTDEYLGLKRRKGKKNSPCVIL